MIRAPHGGARFVVVRSQRRLAVEQSESAAETMDDGRVGALVLAAPGFTRFGRLAAPGAGPRIRVAAAERKHADGDFAVLLLLCRALFDDFDARADALTIAWKWHIHTSPWLQSSPESTQLQLKRKAHLELTGRSLACTTREVCR